MKHRIYLAGAINGCSDAEAIDWRAEAKRLLAPLECLDPMARDYRGREALNVREIVEQDKRDIDECRGMLVHYGRPSVGTAMEIHYGWMYARLIVLVDKSGKPLSPWLTYHATAVVPTIEEGAAWLKRALSVAP